MQELIDRIVEKTGLAPEKAERAAGIMLSLVKSRTRWSGCSTHFQVQQTLLTGMVQMVAKLAACSTCWVAA